MRCFRPGIANNKKTGRDAGQLEERGITVFKSLLTGSGPIITNLAAERGPDASTSL